MTRYIKTAFNFVHTYILILIGIALPIGFELFLKPLVLFHIIGIGVEILLFIWYLAGLPNVEQFKRKYNIQNYDRFMNKSFFMRNIHRFHPDVKSLLEDFYTQADNIIKEFHMKDINDIVAKSMMNVVMLGEKYTLLNKRIKRQMGNAEQRNKMITLNKKRYELIKSAYKELKTLGGKLILMNEEGSSKDEKYFLDQIYIMNEVLEEAE